MKRKFRIAGLAIIALAAVMTIYWESGGREHFTYEKIPVMARDVPRGTVITGSMISLRSEEGVEGCFEEKDAERIVGMTAKHDLHAGIPLFASDIADPKGDSKGKLIMTVPSSEIANGITGIAVGDALILMFDGSELARSMVLSVADDRSHFDMSLTPEEAVRMSECSANGRRPIIIRE